MWYSARVVVTTATRIRSAIEHLMFEHRAGRDCDLQTATHKRFVWANSRTRSQRNEIWIRQGVPGGQVTRDMPRATSYERDVRLTWLRTLDAVPKHAFRRPNGLNQPDHRLGVSGSSVIRTCPSPIERDVLLKYPRSESYCERSGLGANRVIRPTDWEVEALSKCRNRTKVQLIIRSRI